jgi:hypothetical protein
VTNVINFDHAQRDRPPIAIPSWVPADVAACIRNRIEPFSFIPDAEHDAMSRLANDPRMKAVWKQLNNRQNLGRLFYFVWAAARDGQRETTQKENEAQIEARRHEIEILRIVAARRKKETNLLYEREIRKKDNDLIWMDGEAFMRWHGFHSRVISMCAEIEELEAELPFLRGADDPLTRSHGRNKYNKRPSVNSDPRALGVGKVIAKFLNENFGNPMCGTACTLMIVVLGLDPHKAPTRRAIRVAFEKDRCAQGR